MLNKDSVWFTCFVQASFDDSSVTPCALQPLRREIVFPLFCGGDIPTLLHLLLPGLSFSLPRQESIPQPPPAPRIQSASPPPDYVLVWHSNPPVKSYLSDTLTPE